MRGLAIFSIRVVPLYYRRHFRGELIVMKRSSSMLLSIIFVFSIGTSHAADDLGAVQREIEDLKQGQLSIQKELQEIKSLLLRTPQPAPVRAAALPEDTSSLISVDGAPFKGQATAK